LNRQARSTFFDRRLAEKRIQTLIRNKWISYNHYIPGILCPALSGFLKQVALYVLEHKVFMYDRISLQFFHHPFVLPTRAALGWTKTLESCFYLHPFNMSQQADLGHVLYARPSKCLNPFSIHRQTLPCQTCLRIEADQNHHFIDD